MPEIQKLEQFDANAPVYVIKQFFYGATGSSLRHPSDHPLRLDQIPVKYRTKEYLRQGVVKSTIPSMIQHESESKGLTFEDPKSVEPKNSNPLDLPQDKDEKGNILPQSTPTAVRKATRTKAKEKQAASSTSNTAKKS